MTKRDKNGQQIRNKRPTSPGSTFRPKRLLNPKKVLSLQSKRGNLTKIVFLLAKFVVLFVAPTRKIALFAFAKIGVI